MFRELTITGAGGALLYGYAEAALLGPWGIERLTSDPRRGPWVLTAIIRTRHPLWCASRPLLFTARKLGGGSNWCWPVLDIQYLDGGYRLQARLGPPEQ